MSIIYDALKKVERAQNLNSKKIDKADFPKPKVYLIYALVVVLGFFVTNLFWGFFIKSLSTNTSVVSKDLPEVTKVEATVSTTAEVPTPAPVPDSVENKPKLTFTLNGVFFSADEGYALINNQIAKVGDTIEGAKVLRISMDEVELESEGSVLSLRH